MYTLYTDETTVLTTVIGFLSRRRNFQTRAWQNDWPGFDAVGDISYTHTIITYNIIHVRLRFSEPEVMRYSRGKPLLKLHNFTLVFAVFIIYNNNNIILYMHSNVIGIHISLKGTNRYTFFIEILLNRLKINQLVNQDYSHNIFDKNLTSI